MGLVDFRFSSGYKNRVLLEAKLEKIVWNGLKTMIKYFSFAMATRRIAGNRRNLWDRTGQIAAFGKVGYYGFATSEDI